MDDLEKIAQHYQPDDFDFISLKYVFKIAKKYYYGTTFLELGCSLGFSTTQLLASSEILDIIDASKKIIGITKKNIAPILNEKNVIITFHHSRWEDFKFKQNYYSDIFWFRGLEHVESPDKLIDNLKKSLVQKGRIHILVPNALALHRQLGVQMGMLSTPYDLNERDKRFGHYKVYDNKSLTSLLKQHEFKIITSQGIILKPLPNDKMARLYNEKPQLIDGYFKLGQKYPDLCGEIYICASPV